MACPSSGMEEPEVAMKPGDWGRVRREEAHFRGQPGLCPRGLWGGETGAQEGRTAVQVNDWV